MRNLRELRLLEIGVDPNVGQRAQRHQLLSGKHFITWIHIPPRHNAVDVGDHIAIAEVQLRLTQIGARSSQLRACLDDIGSGLEELRNDGIEVARRIALVEISEHLVGRLLKRRRDTELRGGLLKARLCGLNL